MKQWDIVIYDQTTAMRTTTTHTFSKNYAKKNAYLLDLLGELDRA